MILDWRKGIVFLIVTLPLIFMILTRYTASAADPLRQAEETAENIRGETGLVVNGPFNTPIFSFELVNISSLDEKILQGPSLQKYKPVFAVKEKQSYDLYVILYDYYHDEYLILYIHPNGSQLVKKLFFTKVSSEYIEKEGSRQEVVINDNKKVTIEGHLACQLDKYTAEYVSLQTSYMDFDCWYTTKFGSYNLVTTHAKGRVFYIPGQYVTGFTDRSYDVIHDPGITGCWFKSSSSGAGLPQATLKAEGKYLICWSLIPLPVSTQWNQFARFIFDAVTETPDCEGMHNSWVSYNCNC
ncbi:MAG: hypothetical protein QW291_03330 [Thermofilaceae archaeon]